ncbi:AI-2E family transporter [Pedobacter sp. MW01-1-1]|uniref:AI-2E family transporter n=1 Tax=Pedobacter sp. MW01-1-1 TaxID=3383027 RepID=UPI003FEFB8F5
MKEFPLTVKRSLELLGITLIVAILYVGKDIFMPILMAFFISLMLLPIYRWLLKHRVPESISIILPIFIVLLALGGIVWFFSLQIGILADDFPQIKENVSKHLQSIKEWISGFTGINTQKQTKFINDKSDDLINMGGKMASGAAVTLSSVFVFVGLLPIYIYLILFYKDNLLRFSFMWFKAEDHSKVKEVVYQTESIVKSYLVGLLIQITYMTILLGGTLWLLGIKHALLIGALFALLNLIPYVGALLGNVLSMLITLTSSTELWPVLTVVLVIAVVQFLDNNILMPRIVGSKVKINALFTIMGVFLGGAIGGVAGMFLSLPIIAILKIIFDHTDQFKQWGVLLGDERPGKSPMRFPSFRKQTTTKTKSGVIPKK